MSPRKAKMANEEKKVTAEIPVILVSEMRPKQAVTDLVSGKDTNIEVAYSKFSVPVFDAAKHGDDEEKFWGHLFVAARKLVTPVSVQVEALLYRATQDSYQAGKTKALATGDFLTSELRAKIVAVMRGYASYADLSAKDAYERWTDGFRAAKPGALKILVTAKALTGSGEDLDL
jgi:hypothetical protein